MINLVIYSYKGKHVIDNIHTLVENAPEDLHITLIDQHPMDRSAKLKDLDNVHYKHVFWDKINSPSLRKREVLLATDLSHAPYSMVMADDIVVSPDWDKLIEQAEMDRIVSGFGKTTVVNADKYLLGVDTEPSNSFELSHYVDKRFIFLKTENLRITDYPTDVKYRGENELLSAIAFYKHLEVYSAPSTMLVQDQEERTLENLYVPFSIEHNYNQTMDTIKEEYHGWLDFHNIDRDSIMRIPYQIDDVLYDPYKLKMVEMGGERFFGQTRAIY